MGESNQVILTRFFTSTNELDVFLNGKYLYTFEDAHNLPWQLIEFLEYIGYKTFEKQMYEKRWYTLSERSKTNQRRKDCENYRSYLL